MLNQRKPSVGSQSRSGPQRLTLLRGTPVSAQQYQPVTARCGYSDALGLFAVAFGPFALTAIVDCAHLLGAPLSAKLV